MDPPGIEPGAFRLQSERDTTTPPTQLTILLTFFTMINIKFDP